MTATSRQVTVWYDDRSGVEPGWVARCTDFDETGESIMGRIAMDEPVDAESVEDAIVEASRYWGVPEDEVTEES